MRLKTLLPIAMLTVAFAVSVNTIPVSATFTSVASNSSPHLVTSSSWAVVAESTVDGNQKGALNLGIVGSSPGSIFYLVNFGSIPVLSGIMVPTAPTGSQTVSFSYCQISATTYGLFLASSFTSCSAGTVVDICPIVSSTNLTCPYSLPLNVGANVQVRITTNAGTNKKKGNNGEGEGECEGENTSTGISEIINVYVSNSGAVRVSSTNNS